MAVKITSTQFEALVQASEEPRPLALDLDAGRPINPLLFPHDWSLQCTLETVWQTDVTESINLHQERWSLLPRPLRKQTARFQGTSKKEAYALLQSLQAGSSQFGYPVPIFCDQVKVTGVVADGPRYVISGDFSRRRFFRGGRVVFMALFPDPLQSAESSTFARVLAVAPHQLVVTLDQGTTRAPTSRDLAFPCMDVETLESSSGVALTDSVYTVDITWTEVEGDCSLPACWPAVVAGDSSVLSPFCSIVGGYALFPFSTNWADGVEISTRRRIETHGLGLTVVQDPSGVSFLEFAISVMGYNREASWDVLRFFDAMRGRAGLFLLRHPLSPWSFQSYVSGGVRIEGSSNPASMLSSTRKAIATLANGDLELVTITDVTELSGGIYQIDWDETLIDDVVELQPAYVCRFDSDALQETWATDSVIPNMTFGIVEDAQSGAQVVLSEHLGHTQQPSSFSGVPDIFLLLNAGSNGTSSDARAVRPYPNLPNRVSYWGHSAQNLQTSTAGLSNVKFGFDASPSTTVNRLVLPLPSYRNNGKPYIQNPKFGLSFMLDSSLPVRDRQPWSVEDGWTMFFCVTPYIVPIVQRVMHFYECVSPEFSLNVTMDDSITAPPARGRLSWSFPGGPGGLPTVLPFTIDRTGTGAPTILTVRFGGTANGNTLHVWMNGEAAAAPFVISALPNASSFSVSKLFEGFNNGTAVSAPLIASYWGNNPGANSVAMYRRALTEGEMNSILTAYSGSYLTDIKPVVLY